MTHTAERIEETLTPLERVQRRLAGRTGFPALSATISEINRIVSSDTDSVHKLTKTILRDVALTNKLLQVINSAAYGQFGGRIHTISKAVLILGFEAIRNVAMSLVILEFSQGKAQQKTLQDEIVGAFFAGVLSTSLCQRLHLRNGEEGVICTMFQNLGRLLALFFLYEESQQIVECMATGLTEDEASEQVLGISYSNLGIGMAIHWNFPERLVHGMQRVTAGALQPPRTDADELKLAANLANELYNTALRCPQANKKAALEALALRYSDAIEINTENLTAAINDGLKEIGDRGRTLNLAVANSQKLHTIKTWVGSNEATSTTAAASSIDTDPLLQDVNALDKAAETARDPEQVLADGVRDVTETLAADFALNDILQMVLETMHRGMGFERTLIFIRDSKLNAMRARFGFGPHIEQIIQKCVFPLAFAPDVFHVALDKGVDIIIEDAQAPNIVNRIPQWHRQAITAKSFLLLPLVIKDKTIGMFYADSNQPGGAKITTQQLGLLRTLRSQAVIAFKQKM